MTACSQGRLQRWWAIRLCLRKLHRFIKIKTEKHLSAAVSSAVEDKDPRLVRTEVVSGEESPFFTGDPSFGAMDADVAAGRV